MMITKGHPMTTPAVCESVRAVPQWQPIGCAPKDGTPVLATWLESWPQSPHIEGCWFDRLMEEESVYEHGWRYSQDSDQPMTPPTHWQSLPLPPIPEPSEKGEA